MECFGLIKLNIEIGPTKFEANFWVFDMNPKLLVGRDLISKHNVCHQNVLVVTLSMCRMPFHARRVVLSLNGTMNFVI